MKKIYWTAYNVHPYLMTALCIIALLCLYFVENNKRDVAQPHYGLKLEAAQLADKAFIELKKQRRRQGIRIDKQFDPAMTGLIGRNDTPITSDHGVLRSKQISLNPNLAALILQWLLDLKLKEGDTIAVGMTGSFPALDVSTLAAIKTLKLNPILIVSSTASQWGANIPGFSWLDMLHDLNRKKIFDYQPIAASIGSANDTGKDLTPRGVKIALATINKYKIPLIKEEFVSESIDKRLALYKKTADDTQIKAYINIGGGVASIGKHFSKSNLTGEQKEQIRRTSLKTGINQSLPVALANTTSVAIRYLKRGIPVINIREIVRIAADYNLKPWSQYDLIGVGPLFFHHQYNLYYAFFSLLLIMLACWGQVYLQMQKKKHDAGEIQ